MQLSIITVNYKSWAYLESALEALATDFPADWEMIVVDNESQADTLDTFAARFPWVNFIANPDNSGFGHGCNIGVEQASGKRLLFMNPDVVAKVADIQLLIETKQEHNIGIIAPKQVSAKGNNQKVFDDFPNLWNQSKTVKALLRLAAAITFS